jgi:serine/threonine protein kinase
MAAHAQGVVHRDIKPANVLLESLLGNNSLVRVKLTDFGIARAEGLPVLTSANEAMGTPEYMSPEQITGADIDPRCDLYAVGLVLYRMATGRLPFIATNPVGYFTQHISKLPPPPREFAPELPMWLETLILELLNKDPADRVQTAAELVRRLDAGSAKEQKPALEGEAKRLAALRSYQVLDTEAEQAFDDLTFLASQICGTPIAAVSLIDEDRQWFKSKVGLSVSQTARNLSFCQYTIRGTTPLIVGNASTDPQFADHPLVKDEPRIRFYAGVPLIDPEGCALGSLCVVDRVARGLSSDQLAALAALGRLVMTLLNNRREMLTLRRS